MRYMIVLVDGPCRGMRDTVDADPAGSPPSIVRALAPTQLPAAVVAPEPVLTPDHDDHTYLRYTTGGDGSNNRPYEYRHSPTCGCDWVSQGLYRDLHAARERLCRAQDDLPMMHRTLLDEAIARIDLVGTFHCPQWFKRDLPLTALDDGVSG